MRIARASLAALSSVSFLLMAGAGVAQSAGTATPASAPALDGAGLVAKNCFQCHTDTMFRDQHQDARAWKATIYRMVGRGGRWPQDEIDAMADYLGTVLGRAVTPAAVRSK